MSNMKRYQPIPVGGAILLILSMALRTTAQITPATGTPGQIAADLTAYQRVRLQEKLYVHTDKEFYLSGEICWFKLYVVNATNHQPMDLSKVAYLEWLDKDNKPILQAKAGLAKGYGDGSAYLPLTLRSGTYKLRGYTSWMKNYGANWFFEKTITIVNARRSAELSAVADSMYYPISFFPEGGNFIENIACKLGFRITDKYGRGMECSGVVTEDDQDTVARFQPYRFGIGNFMLTAKPGHRYRAIFRLPDGTAVPTLLPTPTSQGVAMSVTPEGQDRWRVNVQAAAAAGSSGEVYLVAHTRQQVKLAIAATLADGKASFLVDKQTLGEGISTLTLFNSAKQPVCERLVFRQPAHPLQITVQPDKQQYGTRQKIDLAVSTSGDTSAPQCSLSVYRVDALQTAPESRIGNYLWLASDLKGKVESPGYYFEHPEDEQAMDNLLLTHGWRRLHWGDAQSHSAPLFDFPPEYNGAIISGKVTDMHSGGPGKGIQVYLSVPGLRTQFTSAFSDDDGRVHFELKDFYGGQEIILETNPRDSFYRVEMQSPWAEEFTDDRLLIPYQLPKLDSGMLSDRDVALQVLNRYGAEKLKKFRLPAIADTTPFYYRPDYSYMLDDYTRFTTMEEVMREYVVLMLVQRRSGHYHLPLFELPYNQFFDGDPLILLDGVPVFNIDSLMVLDPLKMKRLQTVHRKYFMGSTYYPGIMNWTTYKGDLGGYILDPRSTVVDYEGLSMAREFYEPVYPTPEAAASHLPDFRNVLYWTPSVPIGPGGKGSLSFYTSDLPGKYIVVTEGLTADGSAGTGIASFEVK